MIDSFSDKYRFLSNFWYCRIKYNGLIYTSVEAAFQATKCKDKKQRAAFINLSPAVAKRVGRSVTLRSDWEQIKNQVMLDLLRLKFSDPNLNELLLATGDRKLVEGNTWGDVYWGVCHGKGENWLGKLLMKVRKENRAFKEYEDAKT